MSKINYLLASYVLPDYLYTSCLLQMGEPSFLNFWWDVALLVQKWSISIGNFMLLSVIWAASPSPSPSARARARARAI